MEIFNVYLPLWQAIIGCTVFLISVVIIFINSLADSDSDRGGGAAITILAMLYLVISYFFGNRELFIQISEWIRNNNLSVLMILVSYIVLGILWSIFRFYIYLKDHVKEYPNYEFLPTPAKCRDKILTWMSWWPISMTATIFHRPFKWLFNFIYDNIVHMYMYVHSTVLKSLQSKNEK